MIQGGARLRFGRDAARITRTADVLGILDGPRNQRQKPDRDLSAWLEEKVIRA